MTTLIPNWKVSTRVLRSVLEHPRNRSHPIRAVLRVLHFQAAGRWLGRGLVVPYGERSRFIARLDDAPSRRAAYSPLPDWAEMQVWMRHLRYGDIFVDVGASVGLYTILAAELGCEVISVEPLARNLRQLSANLSLNGYSSEIIASALSDAMGEGSLAGPDASRQHLVPDVDGPSRALRVPLTTLDDVLEGRFAAGVKIDLKEQNAKCSLAPRRAFPSTVRTHPDRVEPRESAELWRGPRNNSCDPRRCRLRAPEAQPVWRPPSLAGGQCRARCLRQTPRCSAMKIHWYWPYSHPTTFPLVLAVQRPGDEVVVQALSTRFGVPIESVTDYEVIRDLPETGGVVPGKRGPSWMLERGRIYRRRALARTRLLRSRAFDVSCQHHLNSFTDWFYLRRAPERTALVSFVHDVIPHEPRVPRSIDHALHKHTYRAAGELVVYHRSLKSQLIEDFGVEEAEFHVIKHPLRPPPPGLRPPETSGEMRLLYFGVFRANKGLDTLIDAARLLRDDRKVMLRIAGRGNANLEYLVRSAADELPNVTCEIAYVPKDSMERLFRESHVAVLPYSSMASQSGVLAAAYSNALPVIVTDVGALGETVREDGTGVVVPPNDPAALAASISSIASTPSRIHQFSEAIHAVAPDYSHERVGMSLRAVFDHAVTRLSREGR